MKATTTLGGRLTTPTGRLVLPASAPREQWLAARRDGITATDVVKIMGLTQYGTLLDVYRDKTAGDFWADDEMSEAAAWGIDLEDVVAQSWAERHGLKVRRVGLLARDGDDWARASLDRLVYGCDLTVGMRGSCGLEVKTRNAWVLADWQQGVPADVVAQCQWQMFVAGLDHIHVAALVGGQRLVDHVVHQDEAETAHLLARASHLWACVQAGEFPPFDPATWTVDMLDEAMPNREGAVEVDPSLIADVEAYRYCTTEIAALSKDKEAARDRLILALGAGDTALIGGHPVFTYRPQSRTTVDAKALAADFPDAYTAVTKTTTSRTFRLAKESQS
jgi:putative phage-type endonuclease